MAIMEATGASPEGNNGSHWRATGALSEGNNAANKKGKGRPNDGPKSGTNGKNSNWRLR